MSKTVIVTGASGNLGNAVTKEILDKGYTVIATVSSEENKKSLPQHERLFSAIANLTDENSTEQFVLDSIQQHGKIQAALLLVGGFSAGNIQNTTTADLKKQIELNFDTAFHVARPLFNHMLLNEGGQIVFIGARPAIEADSGKDLLAYGLSKSLLFTFAEYLNAEAKGRNFNATVLVPSTLDTPLNRKNMPQVDPANWVTPESLAEVLEFLISEKAAALRETVLKVYNNS